MNYLITRDWETESDNTELETARSGYIDARSATGNTQLTANTGNYGNNRGTTINGIGGNQGVINSQLATLEGKIRELVVGGLGLTGVTHAGEMVDALIIQLGQDAEELRAFVKDLKAENIKDGDLGAWETPMRDSTYAIRNGGWVDEVTSVAPQSVQRLAHVDAKRSNCGRQGCTSRKAASYNQFPCNTAPQGLMTAVCMFWFLQGKNQKLKNGTDAAIPGVSRSETP